VIDTESQALLTEGDEKVKMTMSEPTIPPHKSKGRPRSFDRQAALIRALGVFWRRGYEPASISELCAAMEINPPSLYAAFGNKAQLFMEAVLHYETVYWDAAWERMAQLADIREAMSGFFRQAAQILTSQDAPCGCLVILAATNISAEGQGVNDALKALRKEGREWFLARIKRAVEDGQLPSDTDTEALASALNTMLEGMSLQARDGALQDELERVGAMAMSMLHSPVNRETV
jgi:AcrR family transcriptional regulator